MKTFHLLEVLSFCMIPVEPSYLFLKNRYVTPHLYLSTILIDRQHCMFVCFTTIMKTNWASLSISKK